jgi:hypothetical protein
MMTMKEEKRPQLKKYSIEKIWWKRGNGESHNPGK